MTVASLAALMKELHCAISENTSQKSFFVHSQTAPSQPAGEYMTRTYMLVGMYVSRAYGCSFFGIAVSIGHALVDTGAQSGVVGLYYWTLWCETLLRDFGLRPLFKPVPESSSAGGVGGSSAILAICVMPMGIAGVPGLMEWAVCEDSPQDNAPPLLPISWQKDADAAIEPKQRRMTLRAHGNAVAKLHDLPTEHQTTSVLEFGEDGWCLPPEHLTYYKNKYGGNPFIKGSKFGYQPEDSRLDVDRILENGLTKSHTYQCVCVLVVPLVRYQMFLMSQ